jgi:hypothetical protein
MFVFSKDGVVEQSLTSKILLIKPESTAMLVSSELYICLCIPNCNLCAIPDSSQNNNVNEFHQN